MTAVFCGRRKPSSDADLLSARPFRPLPLFERDCLSFPQRIKVRIDAGRPVEEVFRPVARRDEPESFLCHQSFNRPAHRRRHRHSRRFVNCQFQVRPVGQSLFRVAKS